MSRLRFASKILSTRAEPFITIPHAFLIILKEFLKFSTVYIWNDLVRSNIISIK